MACAKSSGIETPGTESVERALKLAQAKISELEATLSIYEKKSQRTDAAGSTVAIAIDTDVVQNRLAKEIERSSALEDQNDKLSEIVESGQADRNVLLLQLSEQTSRAESLEEQLRKSKTSANVLLQTSIVFEDKLRRVATYSEKEQVLLKTVFNESREILDTIECSLETEVLSMHKYVAHLQAIPDPRGEFHQLKYNGLLNEIMSLLENLKKMKLNIDSFGNHLEAKFLSAAEHTSPPPSPITTLSAAPSGGGDRGGEDSRR